MSKPSIETATVDSNIGETIAIEQPKTIEALSELLIQKNIDTSGWNTPKTKSIPDLFSEIVTGESMLEIRNKKIIRAISIIGINVFTTIRGSHMRLVERKRVSGNTPHSRLLRTSISERKSFHEDLFAAAIRITENVLSISTEPHYFIEGNKHITYIDPDAFPCLATRACERRLAINISPNSARLSGYTVLLDNETIHFEWSPTT